MNKIKKILNAAVLNSFWPLVVTGVIYVILLILNPDSTSLLMGTMIVAGVVNLFIAVGMGFLDKVSEELFRQLLGFIGVGVMLLIAVELIYPSYTEKKAVKSVMIYEDARNFKMDVVTVDDENVTFFMPEKEAIRLADINDSSKFRVTLEYLFDGSRIIAKNYSTLTAAKPKKILKKF